MRIENKRSARKLSETRRKKSPYGWTPNQEPDLLQRAILGTVGALLGGALTAISYVWLTLYDGTYYAHVTLAGAAIGFCAAALEGESILLEVLQCVGRNLTRLRWRL